MGDSMQLFQQQFEAFMKRYNKDQQRIQSHIDEIRRENTNNSATHESCVNRRNKEGPDRGGGGLGAQIVAVNWIFLEDEYGSATSRGRCLVLFFKTGQGSPTYELGGVQGPLPPMI
ncbi:hypothetical protein Tco_0899473 [Tanacetum coccineum]